jgi:hypothetical protein
LQQPVSSNSKFTGNSLLEEIQKTMTLFEEEVLSPSLVSIECTQRKYFQEVTVTLKL